MKLRPLNFERLTTAIAIGLLALHLGCSGGSEGPADQSAKAPSPASPATETPTAESPASESQAESPATESQVAEQPAAEPPVAQSPAAPAAPSTPAAPIAQTSETVPSKPDATPEDTTAPIVVPEGTPEQLFAFIESLKTKEPPARDRESMQAFMTQLGQAILTASDRLLAAKLTDEQASEAVQYKLVALSLLERAGDTSAAEKRAAMPAELKAAGHGSLVRLVELDALINRFQGLRTAGPQAFEPFAEDLAKFFEKSAPKPEEAALAMQVANTLERVMKPQDLAKYYERYGKVFAGLDDEQAKQMGATMIGAARRMQLMGHEMPLEGLSLDGKELKWDTYRGKVVLVDFWATWCGPCLEEMTNIRANYDKFHDRGFDVVGISVDENREALVSFLKDNKLPWTVLVDQDLEKAGKETMATHYGIFGIPNLALVGKDGKVVALDPRGPELGEKLAELLGEPEAAKPAPAPATPEPKPAATTPEPAPAVKTPKPEPAPAAAEPKAKDS